MATAAAVAAAGALPSVASGTTPRAPSSDARPSACAHRVNNTPQKLVDCVTKDDLWAHMVKFQQIADANPGADGHPSRNSGEPGYKASADYVAGVMRAAGYDVTLQEYKFHYFSFVGDPLFREESPTPQSFGLGTEFNPGTVAGSTSSKLQPAGGIVVPATPEPSSASGCSASDFAGFGVGNIALIQRGTCTFAEKVANAEAAGASAAVIFNEGNPGRTSLFNGSLAGTEHIPVIFTSYAVGTQLLGQYVPGSGPVLTIDVKAIDDPNRSDWNVIADSKGGDPNNILVIDAHLDAIFGAGMLDNASGSATILDIAQQLRNTNTRNKLRFIWFGAEELPPALIGSTFYVNSLSQAERDQIEMMLNFDMVGSPNFVRFVYDGDNSSFPVGPGAALGPAGSGTLEQAFNDYFDSQGLAKAPTPFSGRSDYGPFIAVGIPASGLFTGAEGIKTAAEAATFGGTAGQQYDPCYHLACDTFSGTDAQLALRGLDQMSDAVAHSVLLFSKRNFDKQPLASSATAFSTRSALTSDISHNDEAQSEPK